MYFLDKTNKNNIEGVGRDNQFGFDLFVRVIKERYLDLISLNLIFLLYCIPIVTIGPAVKALSKVTMDLARDKLVRPVNDFKCEFKKGFLNSLLVSFLFCIFLIWLWISFKYYTIGIADNGLNIVFIILDIFLTAITILAFVFYFKSVELFDLSKKEILINSFILAYSKPLYILGVVIVGGLFCYLILRYTFIMVFLYCLILFVFISLTTSFMAWDVIKKYIVIEK